MAKSADNIRGSLMIMRRLGGTLRTLFSLLIILTVMLMIWVVATVVQRMAETPGAELGAVVSMEGVSLHLAPAILWFVIGLFLEAILWGISNDIARGQSPFTEGHAKKIAVLGLMFVINSLVALFYRGNVVIDLGVFYFSYWPSPMVLILAVGNGVTIDIGSILVALVSFSVAAMWKYAALLQTQSDGLV